MNLTTEAQRHKENFLKIKSLVFLLLSFVFSLSFPFLLNYNSLITMEHYAG